MLSSSIAAMNNSLRPSSKLVVSKSMLVAAAVLLVGFWAALALLTKPLWAKEKPLYVGDFGPRLCRRMVNSYCPITRVCNGP